MNNLIERDYFTDREVLKNPYAWFDAVRDMGPVAWLPGRDYLVVTGFDEVAAVLRNTQDFSSAIALQGASAPLPFKPEGSDISVQLDKHRPEIHGSDLLVNLDSAAHTRLRALVNRLFTPSRLRANEQFITEYSDKLVRDAVANGKVELISKIATPFVTIVVADLLGIPAEDRQIFMDAIAAAPVPGNLDGEMALDAADHPFVLMGSHFAKYVYERVASPRDDVLSELANGEFPDGTRPDPMEIVSLGMFLFGAGQDTSAKLLGNAMRIIAETPELQERLRADPSLIPSFVEEVLRLEGSSKQTARVSVKDTQIGEVAIPAGTKILLSLSAANRDPCRWVNPQEFELDRPKIKEHLAFGRGAHTCSGAPLARVEMRIILEKFLEHSTHIDMDEAIHGPRGDRSLNYEPSFIIRGLAELNLTLTPR